MRRGGERGQRRRPRVEEPLEATRPSRRRLLSPHEVSRPHPLQRQVVRAAPTAAASGKSGLGVGGSLLLCAGVQRRAAAGRFALGAGRLLRARDARRLLSLPPPDVPRPSERRQRARQVERQRQPPQGGGARAVPPLRVGPRQVRAEQVHRPRHLGEGEDRDEAHGAVAQLDAHLAVAERPRQRHAHAPVHRARGTTRAAGAAGAASAAGAATVAALAGLPPEALVRR